MPADVVIRPAIDRDLDACLELFDLLSELQGPMWVFPVQGNVRQYVAERYRRVATDADALHLVADAGGDVVGMAVGEVVRASRLSERRALEVSNVVVRPSHRGQGIARRLVAGMAAFAAERDAAWLMLRTFAANEPAFRFWEAMGFTPRVVQFVASAGEVTA